MVDTTDPSVRNEVLGMIKSVISGIFLDRTAASVALVSYGSTARVEFGLGRIFDKDQIDAVLDRLQFFRKYKKCELLRLNSLQ